MSAKMQQYETQPTALNFQNGFHNSSAFCLITIYFGTSFRMVPVILWITVYSECIEQLKACVQKASPVCTVATLKYWL